MPGSARSADQSVHIRIGFIWAASASAGAGAVLGVNSSVALKAGIQFDESAGRSRGG